MTDEQRRRYRVLVEYGLTRAQARAALGLDEPAAVVPAAAPAPTTSVVGYEDARRYPLYQLQQRGGGWVSICDRVPDPLAVHRRGGGVPVR